MKRVLSVIVSSEYNGKTTRDFLHFKLNLSTSLIRRIKRIENGLLVNGEAVFVTHILQENDKVEVTIEDEAESSLNISLCDGELNIVFEDDDLLIINKQSGIPSIPSIDHSEPSVAGIVMNYYKSQGKNFVFRCVNRLDKGTSGLMVIAKHAHSHELLKKQLHSGNFEREYTAVATGIIEKSGFVEASIARTKDSIIKRCVDNNGDYAYTDYKVLGIYGENTLLCLKLKTGRTHQIRVHMAYIGHPLVGDFLYGNQTAEINRTALHSSRISLVHPITNTQMTFELPLPSDMYALLKV